MAEFVNRAELMGMLTATETQKAIREMDGSEAYGFFLNMVNNSPTADAVEVVRCALCKACVNIDGGSKAFIWCNRHRMAVSPHDFCSYGERENNA